MRPQVELLDWGVVDYTDALARQRELFDRLIENKAAPSLRGELRRSNPEQNDWIAAGKALAMTAPEIGWLVMCEHPPVYTLGRSGRDENLLVSEDVLIEKGAALHRIERGGDITFHGPGQIVGYPILDLEQPGLGLREYISALEQAVIETVAHFGIEAGRVEGKTGVWIEGTPKECSGQIPRRADALARDDGHRFTDRKICAIGVKASRGVVMHGFALNVTTDLGWFDLINPCGLVGGAVTSIERETGAKIALDEVKRLLRERLSENLGIIIQE